MSRDMLHMRLGSYAERRGAAGSHSETVEGKLLPITGGELPKGFREWRNTATPQWGGDLGWEGKGAKAR